MKRCTDPLCPDCFPDWWDPPPEEMGWGWPYLIYLGLLVIFVVFVVLVMTQGGAFRPEIGG